MSSYAYLYLDDLELYSWRNELDHSILSVFTKDDLTEALGRDAKRLVESRKLNTYDGYEEDEDFSVTLFTIGASKLIDRLSTLGYGEEAFVYFLEGMLDFQLQFTNASSDAQMKAYYEKEKLELQEIADKYPDTKNFSVEAKNRFHEILQLNPCYTLFYYLKNEPDDAMVTLDISEFAYEGWFDNTYFEYKETIGDIERTSSPPIILTEGIFDRRVLKAGVELLYPHLTDFMRFLDTDFKTEGGASAVVKMLKSFAAAGISNRILAIFDNDAAAYDALSILDVKILPSNYKIMHYPNLELAKSYPTIGPQGNAIMNINGSAAAIELYLGEDVLRNINNELLPIQWTGYIKKQGKYQGELLDKSLVQKKFEQKLKTAKRDKNLMLKQDWSGIKLVIEKIVEELSSL